MLRVTLFVRFNGYDFQNELTVKGHEVIAVKSEVRDLLQKLESKERRIHELEGKRPEKFDDCSVEGDGTNVDSDYDDQSKDQLYSLVRRLDEQVRCVKHTIFERDKKRNISCF